MPENGHLNGSQDQQLRFRVFREGVFQKMPALEGQILKEISVRFAGENHLRTQKNTKQSSAQRFLNDPFPKTPFSAADKNGVEKGIFGLKMEFPHFPDFGLSRGRGGSQEWGLFHSVLAN